MAGFVKLDSGILDSTLWVSRPERDIFITALLMATPYELPEPAPQFHAVTGEATGWSVPAGWYGFVPAAGIGIVVRAFIDDKDAGMQALAVLGAPEKGSRTSEHDGRRLVRIDGGYIVLNFIKYRDRDYTAAERSKRWRDRKKKAAADTRVSSDDTRNVTQAEAEVRSREHSSESPSKRVSRKRSSPIECPSDVHHENWQRYQLVRLEKRKPLTSLGLAALRRRCEKRGILLNEAIKGAADNNWLDFDPTWVAPRGAGNGRPRREPLIPNFKTDAEREAYYREA